MEKRKWVMEREYWTKNKYKINSTINVLYFNMLFKLSQKECQHIISLFLIIFLVPLILVVCFFSPYRQVLVIRLIDDAT
jgi:hypothetical protein